MNEETHRNRKLTDEETNRKRKLTDKETKDQNDKNIKK